MEARLKTEKENHPGNRNKTQHDQTAQEGRWEELGSDDAPVGHHDVGLPVTSKWKMASEHFPF